MGDRGRGAVGGGGMDPVRRSCTAAGRELSNYANGTIGGSR